MLGESYQLGDELLAKIRRTGTTSDRIIALDGRSRLSRSIRQARQAYLDMMPQPISPCDYALAERAAIVAAQLLELDRRALVGSLPAGDARMYVSLSGLHSRLLKTLSGRRSARPAGPSLADLFPGMGEGAAA
jgi:hypothetical protein